MNLYKKHLNGILADETGLGKTVQTVAYMAHLAGQEGMPLLEDSNNIIVKYSRCLLIQFVEQSVINTSPVFVHRHLGTPPYCGKDVQVAKLGSGVQALVSWPKDPPVPGQQKGAQISENGRFLLYLKKKTHTHIDNTTP